MLLLCKFIVRELVCYICAASCCTMSMIIEEVEKGMSIRYTLNTSLVSAQQAAA